ncbi:MAG: hypothetical protein HeimC2_02970 [Candidatus Heimdallarchaeota archaeon LC_2]|nr:MAG: hypothetical protein HeimC2_02970 [Candidatus Heimdallarchaeota archaeon LC_2]
MILSIDGKSFVDEKGRKVILRGVNLGGSSKLPYINGSTHIKTTFSDHESVSFTNRPFPIDEADEHFSRLKNWGFNSLRLLTTWEAIEHKGPGMYDTEYIDYFSKICEIAANHDFYIFVDPHQDVWSRMTGGDGAPGWIFDKVGIDITKLSESDAAITMQHHYPKNYPQMVWSMNHHRFGAATMFSLFFGGNDFAPKCKIEGQPVQKYLQSHFINSIIQIAKSVADNPNIIGFGPMNEPGKGYIGVNNIGEHWMRPIIGAAPTPFDSIVAASGHKREVPFYKQKLLGLKKVGKYILNRNEINIWENECIWKREGIWDENNDDQPEILKPNYFFKKNGKPIQFFRDYVKPFSLDYLKKIREIIPNTIIFLEGDPSNSNQLEWGINDPNNIVNASHWYDIATLVTKKFRSWITYDIKQDKLVFTKKRVKQAFKNQLNLGIKVSEQILDGVPTVMGEFGIPYDMNNKKAYRNNNYKKQIQALTLYYDLIDELMLSSIQWNYTSDNNNKWGDLWNNEDLSIFSRDQQTDQNDINSGGRALEGFCRPYPMRINGKPIDYSFDKKLGVFNFTYINNPKLDSETIIYVPEIQFPNGFKLSLSEGKSNIIDQTVRIRSEMEGTITVKITRK